MYAGEVVVCRAGLAMMMRDRVEEQTMFVDSSR